MAKIEFYNDNFKKKVDDFLKKYKKYQKKGYLKNLGIIRKGKNFENNDVYYSNLELTELLYILSINFNQAIRPLPFFKQFILSDEKTLLKANAFISN